MSDKGDGQPTKSPTEIEADITATQQRLADTVDQLMDRTHPKALMHNGVESAKDKVHDQLYDERGELRTQRIATVAGAGVGVIAALVALRILLSKKRR